MPGQDQPQYMELFGYMTNSELYLAIGEIQANVADLKSGQTVMSQDLKELRKSFVKCQLNSHGIGPILSGAGLGGVIGGIAGYFGKLFS